jgi:peptide-methionine (R)-S-oxide reductase
MNEDSKRSNSEWRKALSPEQYEVLRRKGTERAFTGKYYNSKEEGVYRCAGCGNPLFDSDTKFDSGSGWPSYYRPVSDDAVETDEDKSYGMIRTEVLCARCGGHLGHVFPDGPEPTGQRYCINSVSLDFDPRSGSEES